MLLVVDQFEELLGRRDIDDRASRFLALLRASIEADHTPLLCLGTMRSDFLGLFQRNAVLRGIDFESLSLGRCRSTLARPSGKGKEDDVRRALLRMARLSEDGTGADGSDPKRVSARTAETDWLARWSSAGHGIDVGRTVEAKEAEWR